MAESTGPKLILDDDWKKAGATEAKPSGGPAAAPKLVVDSDWKSQAQAEKDRLTKAEEAKKAAAKPGENAGGRGPREMPDADFNALVGTLVTQALLYLGGFPDPQTGRAIVSLDYARFHIDLLGVLETKCKGNLSPEEAADLNQALYELRMRYVEIGKYVENAARKGAAGGAVEPPAAGV
ncbi:MAG: DUF1844 domain-containing protein [Phycisphaerae bacterium]|nr:DUF1844 domain-containing protein [Phycisphaerae bacterium]